jgi:uncharacterized membrane protein
MVNKQMIFRQINNGSLAMWLWYAIIAFASSMRCDSVIQMANKQTDFWHNKRGGIAGFLLYAIIIIVLIIVLIVVLRFLFNVI